MLGVIFNKPTTAIDSELPWPYYNKTKVIYRNGVGMPLELIPESLYRDLLEKENG